MAKAEDPITTLMIRVAYFITGVWGVSFLVDIVDKTYEAPQSVHAAMVIVAGALFGGGLMAGIARTRNKDAVDNGRDRESSDGQ